MAMFVNPNGTQFRYQHMMLLDVDSPSQMVIFLIGFDPSPENEPNIYIYLYTYIYIIYINNIYIYLYMWLSGD